MKMKDGRRFISFFMAMLMVLSVMLPMPITAAVNDLSISNLKVNSKIEPLGIDNAKPVFSWILNSQQHGKAQSAYKIIVSDTKENIQIGNGNIWDSGMTLGENNYDITYDGSNLVSKTKYYWAVKVWDENNEETDYSAISSFETGFMKPDDWNSNAKWISFPTGSENVSMTVSGAKWIWRKDAGDPESAPNTIPRETQWFRKTFTPNQGKIVSKVYFIASADDEYELYFNGEYIGANNGGEAWRTGYIYDITNKVIKDDANVIAAWALNTSAGWAGFIGKIEVRYTDTTTDTFITDNSWKINKTEVAGWTNIDFNDSSWLAPDQCTTYGGGPWGINIIPTVYVDPAFARAASMLRKEFDVTSDIARARVYISGLGMYDLNINGERIAPDTVMNLGQTQYDKTIPYGVYDVTDIIKSGSNAVGVELGHGFWNEPNGVWNGAGAVWRTDVKMRFQLEITDNDGNVQTIFSDDTWDATNTGPTVKNSIYYGETYDARLEKNGWASAGYISDGSWKKAFITTTPTGKLQWQYIDPIRRTTTYKPKEITKLPNGSYVLRSPEMTTGWIKLTMRNVPSDTKIVISYTEKQNSDGSATLINDSWFPDDVLQRDYYIAKGSPIEVFEPKYSYKGYEYIQIDNYPGELTADDVEIYRCNNDVATVSELKTSNSMLNTLHQMMKVTLLNNYQFKPTDTPVYEKNGWTGDANVVLSSMYYNYDVNNYLKYFNEMLADAQMASGDLYEIAPTANWTLSSSSIWTSVFINTAEQFYDNYGNKTIMIEQYDAMSKLANFYISQKLRASNGYVWDNDGLSDWLAPGYGGGGGPEAAAIACTVYAYKAIESMERMATILGKTDDATKYRTALENIYAGFNAKFYKAEGYYDTMNGNTDYRQTSQLLPLAAGLVPNEYKELVVSNLVADIIKKDYHLDTGHAGTKDLLPVLTEYGYADVAYKVLNQKTYPSWGYFISQGATSLWEYWADSTRSRDHYFYGSYDQYMYEYYAGLKNVKDGYKTFELSPLVVGDLEYIDLSMDTVRGKLVSKWNIISKDSIAYDVTIPVGSETTIYLPTSDIINVKLDGVVVNTLMDGIKSVDVENGRVKIVALSGSYSFVSKVDGYELDTTRLVSLVNEAKALTQEDYNTNAWAALKTAVDAGSALLANTNATTIELNAVIAKLEFALADMTNNTIAARLALKKSISDLDSLLFSTGAFFVERWNIFIEVKTRAIQISKALDSSDELMIATKQEVKDAAAALAAFGLPNLALLKTAKAKTTNENQSYKWGLAYVTNGTPRNVNGGGEYAGYCSSVAASVIANDHEEWIYVDLGSVMEIDHAVFYSSVSEPMGGNNAYGFARRFTIDIAVDNPDNAASWATVHNEYKDKNYPVQSFGPLSFNLGKQNARYVRLSALSLNPKPSDSNKYYLQLAQFEVYNTVDRTALLDAYNEYKYYEQSLYTTDSWAGFAAELAKASSLLNNKNAVQASCDATAAALASAAEALEETSYTITATGLIVSGHDANVAIHLNGDIDDKLIEVKIFDITKNVTLIGDSATIELKADEIPAIPASGVAEEYPIYLMLDGVIVAKTFLVVEPNDEDIPGDKLTKITNLQVEYMKNPIGIDVAMPRFSWQLESNGNSIQQTSYRIVVADSLEKLASAIYTWDSGAVKSSDSIGIIYNGPELSATTRYFWKVYANVNKGTVNNSQTAYWETGLMGKKIDVWSGAKWIAETPADNSVNADISTYTIDYDFKINNLASGFYFASNAPQSNCLMWQFNIGSNNDTPLFRPHQWGLAGGSNPIKQVDLSYIMPTGNLRDWYHVTIEVVWNGTQSTIKTYLTPKDGVKTEIDVYQSNYQYYLNKVGFRQIAGSVSEISEFDNIIIKDGSDKVIFSQDFSNSTTSSKIFTQGSIADGTIKVDAVNYLTSEKVTKLPTETSAVSSFPLLRKGFETKAGKTIKSARLYATARGIYEFSINGKKVGDDYFAPGWTDYFYNFQYQTYDVTNMVQSGQNAIGAMLGKGWFSSQTGRTIPDYYKSISLGQSLLGKLVITYDDNSKDIIVTDNTWKYHTGPITECDNLHGESYDANLEIFGWNKAAFDDSQWTNAGTIANFSDSINITSQIGPSVKQIDTLYPISVSEPVEGQFTYDFGQNMVGVPKIKFIGEKGQVVKIRFAEVINTDVSHDGINGGSGPVGTLHTVPLRTARTTDYYTLKGDPNGEVYMPRFTFHGFRYMELTGISKAVPISDIEGIVMSTDNDITGSFETSAPKVNQIYSNIVWGQRGNFLSIPTDCPQRDERMGWTGDTQVFARTATYIQNADQFYSKWLLDLRSWQTDNGGRVSDVVPMVNEPGSANGWGDAAVIVPWQLYQQYGDVGIIKESYTSMKSWVNYLAANSTNYIRPAGGYGDWQAPLGTPSDITNTLYTAYVSKLLAKMAAAIGNNADAETYNTLAKNIMNAFVNKYSKADGTLNLNGQQTPYAMALYFDLAPEDKEELYARLLMENIKNNGWRLNTGFIGVSYLAPALSENNYYDAAYRLLEQEETPSWISCINNGATTFWEYWTSYTKEGGFAPVDVCSFNHYSFGSIGEWLYSGVLGIQRDEANPGYKHFNLKPIPGGSLTYAKGHFDSVYGRINSAWELKDGLFIYDCIVPANTTATVYLMTADADDIIGGIPEGAVAADVVDGRLTLNVGSGSYHFETPYDINNNKNITVSIDNPQEISAKVIIDGVEHALPFKDIIPANTKSIAIVSNDPNYEFAYWNGDVISSYNPLTKIADNMKISANFKYVSSATTNENVDIKLTLPVGNSMLVNGAATTNNISVANGSDLSFDAIPPVAHKFVGWKSPLNILSNPAFLTANDDVDVEPIFDDSIKYLNLALGKAVTSNDTYTSGTAWRVSNLTDGVTTGTGYTSNINYTSVTPSQTIYIEIDLGRNESIDKVVLYPRTDNQSYSDNAHYFPQDYKVLVKADGASDYDTVASETNHADTDKPVEHTFETKNVRYIRIECTKIAANFTPNDRYRFQLAEIETYGFETVRPVTSIAVSADQNITQVMLGDTIKLNATVIPADANTTSISWYIREAVGVDSYGLLSNKGEAVVNGNSIDFTALKSGFVELVAYADDGYGAVGHYRLKLVDPGNIISMTAVPVNIVGGDAANVKVIVDMSTIPEGSSEVKVSLFGVEAVVVNGEAIIKLPVDKAHAVNADTNAEISVFADNVLRGSCEINVVPKPVNVWEPTIIIDENGAANIQFHAAIAAKNGKFKVLVSGESRNYVFDSLNNTISIANVDANDEIIIKNVQLPELYPSFSFTYTMIAQ